MINCEYQRLVTVLFMAPSDVGRDCRLTGGTRVCLCVSYGGLLAL